MKITILTKTGGLPTHEMTGVDAGDVSGAEYCMKRNAR